ncbi:MAG: BMP family ABC transporter substrate-binding protein, partial [Pseudomonadota bacterium]
KVARRFPQTTFMHASGYKQARNVGTYQIRAFQGRYLAGVLAGHMSESKQLGYVAAFPIPEVIRGINAFTLGAQSVDPEIKINVVWLNSWLDTAREREAADLLISRGNDVITHHTETPAIMMAAEAAGAWAIGYQYDRSQFAPTRHLATIAHNWMPVYKEVIRAKLAGEWTSSSIWYGVEHSASQLVSVSGAVERPLRDQLSDMENQIGTGKFRVFSGPIYDTEGQLRVAEGSHLSDAELISQEWYVAGVNNTQ